MAGSVNKVILVGNLGADPDVRSLQSGDEMVSLSLATSESWKDKSTGERREKTEWHRVTIFNAYLADIAKRYLKKGSKVYLEGQLQTRKYTDKAGIERYSTDVVLPRYQGALTMLGSSGRDSGSSYDNGGYGGGSSSSSSSSSSPSSSPSSSRAPASDDFDDDIPF